MNKNFYKGIALFAIYVSVFAYLVHYVTENAEIMQRIMYASWEWITLGLANSGVCVFLTALLNVSCAKAYGIKIGYGEAAGMTFIAAALNLFLPFQLGSAVKAAYLKKRFGLTYSRYVAIVSGTIVITLIITLVQLIFCLLLSAAYWDVEFSYVCSLAIVLAGFLIGFLLVLRFHYTVCLILPLKKYLLPVAQSFFDLFASERAILVVTANLLVNNFLGGMRFSSIFSMLGYDGSILRGLMYFGFYSASSLMPVLPGNVGISEVAVGILNMLLGADFDAGVTVVLVNRAYYYFVAIIGAAVAAIPMWRLYYK